MLDAKNKTTITILENSDGSFTYTVEYSLLPEMNFSNTYKVNYTIQEVNSTTCGDIIFRLEKLPRWKNPGPLFRRWPRPTSTHGMPERKNTNIDELSHFSFCSVMGNNTMVSESLANNYGMTIRATIEGTALSFTEVFRRVSPTVTGFYVFYSEVQYWIHWLYSILLVLERFG